MSGVSYNTFRDKIYVNSNCDFKTYDLYSYTVPIINAIAANLTATKYSDLNGNSIINTNTNRESAVVFGKGSTIGENGNTSGATNCCGMGTNVSVAGTNVTAIGSDLDYAGSNQVGIGRGIGYTGSTFALNLGFGPTTGAALTVTTFGAIGSVSNGVEMKVLINGRPAAILMSPTATPDPNVATTTDN